jgi:hypothetical protein
MEIVIVSVMLLVGVAYGYYTASGSGIAETQYRQAYSDAPAASARGAPRAATTACRWTAGRAERTCRSPFAALTAAKRSKM